MGPAGRARARAVVWAARVSRSGRTSTVPSRIPRRSSSRAVLAASSAHSKAAPPGRTQSPGGPEARPFWGAAATAVDSSRGNLQSQVCGQKSGNSVTLLYMIPEGETRRKNVPKRTAEEKKRQRSDINNKSRWGLKSHRLFFKNDCAQRTAAAQACFLRSISTMRIT